MNTTSDRLLESPVLNQLREIHARHADRQEGQVATYIPELAKANPDWFGLCIVTTGGHVYEVGDTRQTFTIQSISKPFVYGLALEDHSRTEVLKRIGVEPTGDAFNAISLEAGTGRPRNPMINAGAIAAAGMIEGKSASTKFKRMMEMFSAHAGRELTLDETVYQSESDTGHRNRAIGHMLRNFDILTVPPDPVVDLYFKQCSVSVHCRDLAVMAATLANRGVNPLTGRTAVRGEYVESILSVMGSCGMYDYAGEWLYRVGMPAKSGVSGGVLAVLPGQLGIGVFSPPLDPRGNSVRGLRACDDLSRLFDLHLFNSPRANRSVIRLHFTAAEVNSHRCRTQEESRHLEQHARAIHVYQLQGDLALSTAEVVVHAVLESLPQLQDLILDFQHVLSINECACRMFFLLMTQLHDQGKRVHFTHTSRVSPLRRYFKAKFEDRFESAFHSFPDNDAALEWCENRLLHAGTFPSVRTPPLPPADYDLFADLTPDELALLLPRLERRHYTAAEVIVQEGAPAGELFLIASGSVSVHLRLPGDRSRRVATFSTGMAFGEMAILDGAPRSAMVVADTDVICDLLQLRDFQSLEESHPRILLVLMRHLARNLTHRLRKANREIDAFESECPA
jgi:glutaminase